MDSISSAERKVVVHRIGHGSNVYRSIAMVLKMSYHDLINFRNVLTSVPSEIHFAATRHTLVE